MRKFILVAAIFLVGVPGFSGCGSSQKAENARIYPAGDFTDNGNGTVTDNNTGLMWQQEDDNTKRNLDKGAIYCENFSQGGYSDWRLPDLSELKSILDFNQSNPCIDSTAFPNTNPAIFWSSYIDYDRDPTSAYYVNFYNGTSNRTEKTFTNYVRCVRAGQ